MRTRNSILLTVFLGIALLYGLLILIPLGWGAEQYLILRIAIWVCVFLLLGNLVNAWWNDRHHPHKPNG